MNNEPKNTTDDHLIDKAISELREEFVPAMPSQLPEFEPEPNRPSAEQSRHSSVLAWCMGIAAAALLMTGLATFILSQRDIPKIAASDLPAKIDIHGETAPSNILVENLIALRPFEDLEREIADMKSEIELLKMEAASLDAIRKIDAMLATN